MHDLVIIGAGPAGMAAAVTAADQGLTVVVVDEQQRAGGQIFRQPPGSFTGSELHPTAGYEWATALIHRFEADERLDTRFGWTAIGVLRNDESDLLRVAINHTSEGTRVLGARRVLIATGAYDLPVAFPGWTLPGVMTAGGVQTLVKSQKVAPIGDVVLAGAHPLLLVVADLLVRSGVKVREVAFAQGVPAPGEMLGALAAVPGHVRMLTEAGGIAARLVRHGVRISAHTIVTAARGEGRVSSVALTKVDRNWRRRGAARIVEAEHLVIGYGFSASTELARQLGCALHFDSGAGGWIVSHDEHMRTTVPEVFVAGEPTGVAGADRSRAEGVRAALGVAVSLGRSVDGARIGAAQRDLAASARFAKVVQRVFDPVREALGALADADTIVCRCESITRSDVDELLDGSEFIDDVNAVKLSCRVGMGSCQGRYCEPTVGALVATARDHEIARGGRFNAHLPVKPVPVADLGGLDAAIE